MATSPNSVPDDLLIRNKEYAERFSGPLPAPPAKHLAVVACMDARLDVPGLLGLEVGDAHVIRNAGRVVTAARSARSRSVSVCSARRTSC